MPPDYPAKEFTGFKIRIPRDLPNIPEPFRKRGAIRSPASVNSFPNTPPPASGPVKRSYSTMLTDEYQHNNYVSYAVHSEGSRIKIIRKLAPNIGSIPSHLAGAKNLAIRTNKASATATNTSASASSLGSTIGANGADNANQTAPSKLVKKHRSNSNSKSSSPTPSRIPSPSPSKDTMVVIPMAISNQASDSSKTPSSVGSRTLDSAAQTSTAGSGANGSLPETLDGEDVILNTDLECQNPMDLMRVGLNILSKLYCNTFCKSFINKVPVTLTSYYQLIKKPMDLTTLEQRLWKTLELAGTSSGASTEMVETAKLMAKDVTEGFANLREFERELRRISQNAALFNSPTHIIYKEAQAFQTVCSNILDEYWQGKLDLSTPLPQESYSPDLLSLSEPAPLYIFRAHTMREMERKMTDVSSDLFASYHQAIFDISNELVGQLSPEHPRFVRIYISRNRSILAKSRDEQFARVAILSDVVMGKPYMVSSPAIGTPGSPKVSGGSRNRSGGGSSGSISMVRMTAKVLIGKPIGERHDMVTVGDLDCPMAWITVACVRALDIDVEVPLKFDKGILSKMRHEVAPYSSDTKIGPEHQKAFAKALGLTLSASAKAGQAFGMTGQRSAIPPASQPADTLKYAAPATPATPVTPKGLGLGITTPLAPSPMTVTTPSTKSTPDTPKSTTSNSKSQRSAKDSLVECHDQGPGGRYLVKLRLPSLFNAEQSSPPSSSVQIYPVATSTPSTPQQSSRPNILSSQIPPSPSSLAAEFEAMSAPDRKLRTEQVTKRGLKMLQNLKVAAEQKKVPYDIWADIEPKLTADSAQGLFKRIYHVKGSDNLVVQHFKETDAESFDQRVREVACLLKLRDINGLGQIQSVINDNEDHLVGLSMTKYTYTLKQFATNARQHPSPHQKLYLIRDMVTVMRDIHEAGLAHRDLSEVNIMVDVDKDDLLEDQTPKPHIKVIDFGKSVFVNRDEVIKWSVKEDIPEEELSMLPMVVLPPDHGYKLYRSILTLPKSKHDRDPLPPVDPRSEDVYSLGVLIWRTFSGKSPWNGAIEDDLKRIRYFVANDEQISFQLEREVNGQFSRGLLLRCLTARADTRCNAQQLKDWLDLPEVANGLLKEFEELGSGRKKLRKILD
ncbi:hypothetical protein BGZ76_006381 [Entomortierella beljakovae]|nr:hypothetical protein BGZ76_006381 [Entomortierella beljakovae]